jgi:hypothetical protein
MGQSYSTTSYEKCSPEIDEDTDVDFGIEDVPSSQSSPRIRPAVLLLTVFVMLLLTIIAVHWTKAHFHISSVESTRHFSTSLQGPCLEPSVRREWRQLTIDQRLEYLNAVDCLHRLPSLTSMPVHHSDDFPWVHQQVEHSGCI